MQETDPEELIHQNRREAVARMRLQYRPINPIRFDPVKPQPDFFAITREVVFL